MNWIVHLMLLVWPAIALADAGHDHGATASETSVTLAPRIAAANAEMIEAQAVYGVERAKLVAEIEAARRELEQARTVVQLTEARFTLATDTQRLLAKAFALGELDLVTRLRAENERFEAELNFTRVKLEAARAISRLNQALGVLP